MIEHQLRQTGRTTKLFEKAINYSKKSKGLFCSSSTRNEKNFKNYLKITQI